MLKFKSILVREEEFPDYGDSSSVCTADSAVKLLSGAIGLDKSPQEEVWVIYLDVKSQVIGVSMVSRGTISGASFDAASIYRQGILANAAGVIVAHNHPSGDATPSKADIESTKRVKEVGDIIGIQLLDHIIIGVGSGQFVSMRDENLVEF